MTDVTDIAERNKIAWQQFQETMNQLQDCARLLSEKKSNGETLDEMVKLAKLVLDTDQLYNPRPVRPMYKVNCRDCGKYVHESEHEGMYTVCSSCADANQREMQEMRDFETRRGY